MRRRGEQREDSATLIAMEPEKSYGSIPMDAPVKPPDKNVFSDGSTRIDFVLVWEEQVNANNEESKDVNPAHKKWRKTFLKKLKDAGLLQEQRDILESKTKICFVLLNAPWSVLCYYAEEISLRVPLQVVTDTITNWSAQVLSKLSLPNPMYQDVPNPPPDYYTCQFKANKLQRFLGGDNKETFFKDTQRHQVLYEILARTAYGSVKRGEVGIDRLLNEQVFTAAYPLHEGGFQPPNPPVHPESLGLRQILYTYWASWSCWKRYQPLDHIREYFGEKIALYFAWLGFYTGWLLPASFIGTVVFLVGFWPMATDVPAKELCDSGNTFIMCPLCNICSTWRYSSICSTFRTGIMFDHGGTVFFSVFMSLWAVTFLEYWKRTCSTLSHHWDCSEFQDIEERPRPEFTAMAPMTMRNPVTGAEEPYFPQNKRFNRTLTGFMVIIIMIAMVMMFLLAIILYRTIMKVIISRSSTFLNGAAGIIASLSGSVLNLVAILMLSKVYILLAHILTRWEMHRTQSKYEDMFILKVFAFQFVNFYASPIYIAFFKGRFSGYPGNYNSLFGIRSEQCGQGGCLVELAQELLVIMVGKQLINNIQEFVTPKLKYWWQKRKMSKRQELDDTEETQLDVKEVGAGVEAKEGGEDAKGKVKEKKEDEEKPWESNYELLVCDGLFGEYLEMVIQYGFITIFVAACPLAPLFALINNWLEIRLDAQKFVTEYRRPVAERAQDIGIWFPILQVITQVAVLTNAFLIAFTSTFLPRLYYRYTKDSSLSGYINFTLATSPPNYNQNHTPCRYLGLRDEDGELSPEYYHLLAIRLAFVIVFEHLVFTIGNLIDLMVPDIPEDVELKIKREHYMAKEALAENQSFGKAQFSGETDTSSSKLQRHVSTPKPQPQSDSPPPILKMIPEETSTSDPC